MRALFLLVAAACGGSQHGALGSAGGSNDEGGGSLAQESRQLLLGEDDTAVASSSSRLHANEYGGEAYGGAWYGGDAYGGDPYGGAAYAGIEIPAWNYSTPNRVPHYNVAGGLVGAIEGSVTWTSAPPTKLATACGAIDNPTLHVGSDKGVRGAIVYIDKVIIGRTLPYYGRPASVGGIVAKHGCALLPSAQVVTPLPAALAIHGDATRARIRLTPGKAYELQEGGIVQVEAKTGVTRIDAEDGRLVAAWVLGIDSPYYAITDDSGHYRLDELANGTYDLTFWQPPIATAASDGTFSYGAPIVVHRTVKVEGARPSRVDVALPSR